MKLLIERASETPDPGKRQSTAAAASPQAAKRSGSVVKSLERLKVILRVWKSQA